MPGRFGVRLISCSITWPASTTLRRGANVDPWTVTVVCSLVIYDLLSSGVYVRFKRPGRRPGLDLSSGAGPLQAALEFGVHLAVDAEVVGLLPGLPELLGLIGNDFARGAASV